MDVEGGGRVGEEGVRDGIDGERERKKERGLTFPLLRPIYLLLSFLLQSFTPY